MARYVATGSFAGCTGMTPHHSLRSGIGQNPQSSTPKKLLQITIIHQHIPLIPTNHSKSDFFNKQFVGNEQFVPRRRMDLTILTKRLKMGSLKIRFDLESIDIHSVRFSLFSSLKSLTLFICLAGFDQSTNSQRV